VRGVCTSSYLAVTENLPCVWLSPGSRYRRWPGPSLEKAVCRRRWTAWRRPEVGGESLS